MPGPKNPEMGPIKGPPSEDEIAEIESLVNAPKEQADYFVWKKKIQGEMAEALGEDWAKKMEEFLSSMNQPLEAEEDQKEPDRVLSKLTSMLSHGRTEKKSINAEEVKRAHYLLSSILSRRVINVDGQPTEIYNDPREAMEQQHALALGRKKEELFHYLISEHGRTADEFISNIGASLGLSRQGKENWREENTPRGKFYQDWKKSAKFIDDRVMAFRKKNGLVEKEE